jgi:hypothetical protein
LTELTDLLGRFRRGAELVPTVTAGAAGAELDYQPAPEKWSVRQIVNHLCDSETVAVDRFRRVIAEDNPIIIGYDQEAWVRNLDYQRRPFAQALEAFRRMRNDNYELLKDLPGLIFERVGTHSEQGRLTLLDLLRAQTEHTENHAEQIRSARRTYTQSPAPA